MTRSRSVFICYRSRSFPPVRLALGDVIFKDGDAPDKMYVVVFGEVEI